MPRLAAPQMDELHYTYLDAAIDIVTHQGWMALSFQRLGQSVGKAAATLHEHFGGMDGLHNELIDSAFIFAVQLEQKFSAQPMTSDAERDVSFEFAIAERPMSALLTQVTAAAAVPGSSLNARYRECRLKAVHLLAVAMADERLFGPYPERCRRAQRIVDNHIGICAMIVADSDLGSGVLDYKGL